MAIAIKNLDVALGAEAADIAVSKSLPRADIDAIEIAWRERLVKIVRPALSVRGPAIALLGVSSQHGKARFDPRSNIG
jgi:hypothetical protein